MKTIASVPCSEFLDRKCQKVLFVLKFKIMLLEPYLFLFYIKVSVKSFFTWGEKIVFEIKKFVSYIRNGILTDQKVQKLLIL